MTRLATLASRTAPARTASSEPPAMAAAGWKSPANSGVPSLEAAREIEERPPVMES